MSLTSRVMHHDNFATPALARTACKLTELAARPAVLWILFALGLARGVIFLLAYPPAHQADSNGYFLYAAWLGGTDLPLRTQALPPVYPFLILVTFQWFGSLHWLIGLQWLMSAAIAPLYFHALKRFNPTIALLVALVILGDPQVGVTFNFIATEPVYIFLMAVALNLFLSQIAGENPDPKRDWLNGTTLVLLMLARAVARFLIIPLALVFWLRTRSLRRTLKLIAGYAATLAMFSLLSWLLVGEVQGTSSSNYMVADIMRRNRLWVTPENGPNTVRYLEVQADCRSGLYNCLVEDAGSWDGAMGILVGTALETVIAHWQEYVGLLWDKANDFLALSGQQFGLDPELPAELQCQNPDAEVDALNWRIFERTFGGRSFADYVVAHSEELREMYRPFRKALCPMGPHSPELRQIVDYVMFRYRSLGRPQPYLWYGSLLLLTVLVPWARRYLSVVLTIGATLVYHALVSASISNVQPRYVLVTNPLRAILLGILIYIIVRLVLNLLDWMWTHRGQASQQSHPKMEVEQ